MFHRRRFIRNSVFAAAGLAAGTSLASSAFAASRASRPKISVFTKPFNSLSYAKLAETVAAMGFDGIEAPIRKGGHVDLARIEDELPKLAESLQQHGLEISIMASDINSPTAEAERILKAAKSIGVKRYRLKYFKYDAKPIPDQLANWTATLKDLAALNKQLGMVGLYQNHAGNRYFGAAIWDLVGVLEKIDSPHLGVAYDIRHATVEGGMSWPTTLRRVMPLTQMLYVKDFRWNEKGKLNNVPFGSGQVDPKFYQLAQDAGFDGPISLHEEYLSHSDPKLVPQHVTAMKRDLGKLRKLVNKQ